MSSIGFCSVGLPTNFWMSLSDSMITFMLVCVVWKQSMQIMIGVRTFLSSAIL